jgi:hypothetical protein
MLLFYPIWQLLQFFPPQQYEANSSVSIPATTTITLEIYKCRKPAGFISFSLLLTGLEVVRCHAANLIGTLEKQKNPRCAQRGNLSDTMGTKHPIPLQKKKTKCALSGLSIE